jgi:hypothetical protein
MIEQRLTMGHSRSHDLSDEYGVGTDVHLFKDGALNVGVGSLDDWTAGLAY